MSILVSSMMFVFLLGFLSIFCISYAFIMLPYSILVNRVSPLPSLGLVVKSAILPLFLCVGGVGEWLFISFRSVVIEALYSFVPWIGEVKLASVELRLCFFSVLVYECQDVLRRFLGLVSVYRCNIPLDHFLRLPVFMYLLFVCPANLKPLNCSGGSSHCFFGFFCIFTPIHSIRCCIVFMSSAFVTTRPS